MSDKNFYSTSCYFSSALFCNMLQSTFQQILITVSHVTQHCVSTVELHLSELIGTASHPDMQKIRIIGVFFENGLH